MARARIGLPTTLVAALMAGTAWGQTATVAPAPIVGELPERTAAVFGDWTVQCDGRAGVGRVCEMAQARQDQRQQIAAILALGRLNKDQPFRMVARVPVNVQVATAARLVEGPGPQDPAISLAFRACGPLGCFAEAELADQAAIRRLGGRAADQVGRLEWLDVSGTAVAVPISFRGFGAAFEALSREGN